MSQKISANSQPDEWSELCRVLYGTCTLCQRTNRPAPCLPGHNGRTGHCEQLTISQQSVSIAVNMSTTATLPSPGRQLSMLSLLRRDSVRVCQCSWLRCCCRLPSCLLAALTQSFGHPLSLGCFVIDVALCNVAIGQLAIFTCCARHLNVT